MSTLRKLLGSATLLLVLGSALWAGDISGVVRARPAEGAANAAAAGGNYEKRSLRHLEKIDYDSFRDFVVYIDRIQAPATDGTRPHATVLQKDGEFVPHILPVVAGSEVEWSNMDDIYHNVFSMADACSFDLGLYKRGDESKVTRCDIPGRVDVFCSIHTRMSCVVLVVPNPWFALTGPGGRYTIKNIPAGAYRLKAWHERLPAQVREIVVPTEGAVTADFTLGLGQKPSN